MYESEEEKRKMALSITHYVYRNTALEDYHAECVKMDKEFYKKIYRIVYSKVKDVKMFHKYISGFKGRKLEDKDDLDNLLLTVPEGLRYKFLKYLQHITFGFWFGSSWDPAERINVELKGKSEATFILSGLFLESCEKGEILNDSAMCKINKDIHNRIYSLLVGGFFD